MKNIQKINKLHALAAQVEAIDLEIKALDNMAQDMAEKAEECTISFTWKVPEENKQGVLDADGSLINPSGLTYGSGGPSIFDTFEQRMRIARKQLGLDDEVSDSKPKPNRSAVISSSECLNIIAFLINEKKRKRNNIEAYINNQLKQYV
jgi:hypothetical protein